MNKVELVGRMVDNVKTMTEDGTVVRFKVACDRPYTNKDGKRDADFIPVVAFSNTAKFVAQYFKKGDAIGVTGSIQTGSYEKDGQTVYAVDVRADAVEFVGAKRADKAAASDEQMATDGVDNDLEFK